MFRKVDKLKSEVDGLLNLCQEAGGVADEDVFGPEAKKQERLGVMILKIQEGELEQRYMRRLGKWLQCDEQALRYYVDFQRISAMLHFHYNKNKFSRMLDFIKDCLPVRL